MPVRKTPLILQNRSLLLFLAIRISTAVASQILAVAVGWQMYLLTEKPIYLGYVGLVQFMPILLFTLIVGYAADRFDRRLIICLCQIVTGMGSLLLALGSYSGWITKEGMLVIIFFIGTANAFQNPPIQALLPNVVSREQFPKAMALSASANQCATIIGPALGGLLYSFGPVVVYSITVIVMLTSSAMVFFIRISGEKSEPEPANVKSMLAGVTFIKSKPVILGAISLDLFAVLFGGATALLPVYASKILMVGPSGLGFLRSAPAAGALLMSAYLARRPLKGKVGRIMFAAVMVFGISTVAFGISTSFAISIVILAVLGAANVISVVIRHTMIQLETPDNMRGRVSSVNMMFIGTSNQLGAFESGLTADWFGVVPAVVIGGIGTVIVVAAWMKLFPGLLYYDKLVHSDA